MQYIIVKANNSMQLQARVNDNIKKGYYPQGGIVYNYLAGGEGPFFQAMVKEDQRFNTGPK